MEYTLNTDEFAALNGVKGQTVRKQYCEKKSFFGIMPMKLANGRLKWPKVQATNGSNTAPENTLSDKSTFTCPHCGHALHVSSNDQGQGDRDGAAGTRSPAP